ncbi:hypothetical protein E2C01_056274 [Portunus trituberculatus]|uniref:Uncharacterized protein n=1 Tax=Portunus trituberculatus TaxID=210409 RepID=A0A5B7GPX2_PORTR|nr:hypothetical protein [Portunus trituberculatus]
MAAEVPVSTMTRFHIHSVYYLVLLDSLRNSWGEIEIGETVAMNLLISIDPSYVNKMVESYTNLKKQPNLFHSV